MEVTEAVARRHMTRTFSGNRPSTEMLDRLLAGALRAPSAGNTQALELVVLEGEETDQYWDATTDEAWRARSRRYEGLSRAPVAVLPFVDPEAYAARYREPDKTRGDGAEIVWVVPYWFVDAAFATMSLLLGAADLEIGAAFVGNFRGEEVLRSTLGVPDRFRWLGAVLLGEAAQPDPPSSSAARHRRTPEECVHRGGW